MNINSALNEIQKITLSGNEAEDMDILYSLTDSIHQFKNNEEVKIALFHMFENHPNPAAELGSPGPLVHFLEENTLSELSKHIELLSNSIIRKATTMTIFMAERCFRSKLSKMNYIKLVTSVEHANKEQNAIEVASAIKEVLDEYKT